MTQKDLIEMVALETGVSKKTVKEIYAALVNATSAKLAEGESVALLGFGSFKPKDVSERSGKIPGSDKTYCTPAHRTVRFSPGKKLKERLNS
jgi:DNA-binding protein HU-beta